PAFLLFSVHEPPCGTSRHFGATRNFGRTITTFAATLISFTGDGLMVLVNAPVPVEEPTLKAVDLAVEMQRSVQELIVRWRSRGYQVGFGVGLASGLATVGRIGYESRFDYTAIG